MPFNLTNLPILQDSKKILERTSHLLLPNTRYELDERDAREPERLVSSWTPRHGAADGEPDRELGNGDRNLDRERETTERYTILQKTLMQHKQNQQREREQRERELQQQQHSSILSFQLSQQQQLSSLQQQQVPQSSSSEFSALPFPSALSSDVLDRHDHKDVKDIKSIKLIADAAERSHDDDKSTISPPHDKNQYSPPSDG